MEDVPIAQALLHASSQGNIDEVTQLFSAHDLTIDFSLGDGVFCDLTPLTVAAKYGHNECVGKLLQLGGDLYSMGIFNGIYYVRISDDYVGAIVNAAANDRLECVLKLVEFRFFPHNLDRDASYTNLVTAAKEGNFRCIETVLDTIRDEGNILKGWKGHNIMNLCLLRGCQSSFLRVMIDHGVNINGWDFNGLTPLMCAILGKNLECIQYLLHQGADVRATDLRQCRHFKEDFTIHYFDDVWVRHNRTCLMYAVCVGDIAIITTLLQYLTIDDVNRQEATHGFFPLLYAVMTGNQDVVTLLLEKGADVNLSDFYQRGPICFTIRYGYADLFDFFLDKTTSMDQKYEAAVECIYMKNIKCLQRLIESCSDAICRDEYEGRLLKEAVCDDSMECAQFLIENGHVHADAVFDKGMTALMYCSRYGRYNFVEFIIKYGANLNLTDQEGVTAIRRAAQKSRFECLQVLLNAGADLDIADKQGGTVFCDVIIGDEMCLEMLLTNGALLLDGKLKDVHKNSVKSLGHHINFPLKNILILMHHNIFEWDWALHADYLNKIAFAAVSKGYSPSKCVHYDDQYISLVHLALIRRDLYTVRYLLANLYFLPDDFKVLKSDYAKSMWRKTVFKEVYEESLSLLNQISAQPLGLQSWSFLIISKLLSRNHECSTDRAERVNSLPLPEGIKNKLKFQNAFSNLCSIQWSEIYPEINDKNLCNLLMDKRPVWKTPLINCSPECRVCVGLGKITKSF